MVATAAVTEATISNPYTDRQQAEVLRLIRVMSTSA